MIKRYFAVIREGVKVSLAAASAYRVNFLLNTLIMLVSNILFPLVTIMIYGAGAGFPGWSFYEVLLIQAVFLLSSGLARLMFSNILWVTMQHIVEGTFEIVLIKPLDPLFYLLASSFEIESVSLLLGGAVVFGVAAYNTAAVTLASLMQFLLLFAAGLFVNLGIALIMTATSFKWVGNSRIPEIFDSLQTFGKYPQSIFPTAVRGFASFIMPVAMIGCFPASALLGRAEPMMFAAILPCILFLLAGVLLFRGMIHLYEGVGG